MNSSNIGNDTYKVNNYSLWGNDDWWYSAIGSYGANDMLNSLSKLDPAGNGCVSGACNTYTTTIEGFDGIPDSLIDQFTVTTGLIGKTGGAGTTTQSGAVASSQRAIISGGGGGGTTITSPPSTGGGGSGGGGRRRGGGGSGGRRGYRRRGGRGYPYGDFGYHYDPYYYNDYYIDPIPVPVEVPVEVPVPQQPQQLQQQQSQVSDFLPFAIIIASVILVLGFSKNKLF